MYIHHRICKTCQISLCSEINFFIYFGRRLNLKQDTLVLQTYVRSSFRCEDTAADKQRVNEAIVEKLRLKVNFLLVEQYSMFLLISVNVITSFNNSHTVICGVLTYIC